MKVRMYQNRTVGQGQPNAPEQQEQQWDEEPLSVDADSRYHHADLLCMESLKEREKAEHKKYILKVTGKFQKTNSSL